jgi:hypothetical protein
MIHSLVYAHGMSLCGARGVEWWSDASSLLDLTCSMLTFAGEHPSLAPTYGSLPCGLSLLPFQPRALTLEETSSHLELIPLWGFCTPSSITGLSLSLDDAGCEELEVVCVYKGESGTGGLISFSRVPSILFFFPFFRLLL